MKRVRRGAIDDGLTVQRLAPAQRGVFHTDDLQVALAEEHRAALTRRIDRLLEAGVLRRFSRGWYVAEEFDLPTLCQRIVPESYVSFGWVLAEEGWIGTRPTQRILAVRRGPGRTFQGAGCEVEYVGIAAHLFFGFEARDGVRYADPEKALLDTLYFHLRGRSYAYDVFSDVALDRLDRPKIASYLELYRNPKFVSFAEGVLEDR